MCLYSSVYVYIAYLWSELQMMKWKVKVKVTQSCPAVFDPMDCIVLGILQARILEWVAFPFSKGSSQPRDRTGGTCIAGGFFTNWAIREAFTNDEKNTKLDLNIQFFLERYYIVSDQVVETSLFFLNVLFCIGVYSIKNVVIVSGEQQRDSARHIHIFILPQTPLHPGCHITLSKVLCAIQWVLVG